MVTSVACVLDVVLTMPIVSGAHIQDSREHCLYVNNTKGICGPIHNNDIQWCGSIYANNVRGCGPVHPLKLEGVVQCIH